MIASSSSAMTPDETTKEPSCCSEVKKQLLKSERARDSLRQAVKLLEARLNELEGENSKLQKALEDQKAQGELACKATNNELRIKRELETEIENLKEKISSSKGTSELCGQPKIGDGILENQIVELSKEVAKLRKNLEQETVKVQLEKKKAQSAEARVEIEKKKALEARKLAHAEKQKADEERRRAEVERDRAEKLRLYAEAAKKEASEEQVKAIQEKKKAEDAKRSLLVEKEKAEEQKKHAEVGKKVVKDLRSCIEKERKKSFAEKTRADSLSKVLEEERKQKAELEKELHRALSIGRVKQPEEMLLASNSASKSKRSPYEKLMREKLKRKKLQLDLAKRIAKEERTRRGLVCWELSQLKHDFAKCSQHLDVLENFASYDVESLTTSCLKSYAGGGNADLNLKSKVVSKPPYHENKNCSKPVMECFGPQRTSGQSVAGVLSGTNSELVSPIGATVQNNSATYLISSSFSDRELMGSQGRDKQSVSSSVDRRMYRLAEDQLACSVIGGSIREAVEISPVYDISTIIEDQEHNIVEKLEVSDLVPKIGVRELQDTLDCSKRELRRAHKVMIKESTAKEKMDTFQGKLNPEVGETYPPLSLLGGNLKHVKMSNECNGGDEDGNDFRPCKKRIVPASDHDKEVKKSCFIGRGKPVEIVNFRHKNAGTRIQKDTTCMPNLEIGSGGDVMKLLEFDSGSDEERYQAAFSNPLSPLRKIRLHELTVDNSLKLVDELMLDQTQLAAEDQIHLGDGSHVIGGEKHHLDRVDFDVSEGLVAHCSDQPTDIYGNMVKNDILLPLTTLDTDACLVDMSDEVSNHVEKTSDIRKLNSGAANILEDLKGLKKLSVQGYSAQNGFSQEESATPTSVFLAPLEVRYSDIEETGSRENVDKLLEMNKKAITTSDSPCLSSSRPSDMYMDLIGDVRLEDTHDDFSVLHQVPEVTDKVTHFKEMLDTSTIRITKSLEGTETLKSAVVPSFLAVEFQETCKGIRNRSPGYMVMFADVGLEDLTKAYAALQCCISQSMVASEKVWMVEKLMYCLSTRKELASKERAGIFFSFLLHNFSVMSAYSRGVTIEASELHLDTLISQLKNVLGREETALQLELLCDLIQKFLIDGIAVVFPDEMCDLAIDLSDVKFVKDCQTIPLLRQVNVDLLVSGGIILACISLAVNQIMLLYEASVKLLCLCQKSAFWILTVLHCFTSPCGDRYLAPSSSSLTVSTLQSLVVFLEVGIFNWCPNNSLPSYLLNSSNAAKFPVCKQCPFSICDSSIKNVTDLLLKALESHASVASSGSQESMSLDFQSAPNDLEANNRRELLNMKTASDALMGFLQMDETFLLLELFASYMGWDWTYNQILPTLLKMLDSSPGVDFSMALLLLIGQLGRLGYDASGFEEKGVEELRCDLANILNQKKGCLSVQIAAAGSLVKLLPVGVGEYLYKETIKEDKIQSCSVESLRKWLFQLDEHQRAAILPLLEDGRDVVSNDQQA